MNRLLVLISIFLFILVSSCAPTRSFRNGRLLLSREEVLSRVHQRSELIKTLKGDGNIRFSSRLTSGSGLFTVAIRKPDSLLIDFEGPFGINMASLLLLHNKYLFYNRMDNLVILGNPHTVTFPTVFPVNVSVNDVFQFFTGDFLNGKLTESIEDFSVNNNAYILKVRTEQKVFEYEIDPDVFIVKESRIFDTNGNLLREIKTSRISYKDRIAMPKLMKISFLKEESTLTITYNDIRVNEPLACTLVLPNQVEIINR